MGPFSNMFLFVYDIAGMSLFFQEQFSKLGVNSPLIMRLDIKTGLQHYFDEWNTTENLIVNIQFNIIGLSLCHK